MEELAEPTDRFELKGRLGSGASGVVYAAWDRRRKAPVALKTLRRVDPEAVYRLKQEFRARADVAHPNLVSLFELLQSEDRWVLSMELVDGVPFLEWVRGGGAPTPPATGSTSSSGADRAVPLSAVARLPEATTFDESLIDPALGTPDGAPWLAAEPSPPALPPDPERLRPAFLQLAEAVAALHRAQRLHRDLKPANVLVTRDGRVVVVDFGLTSDLSVPSSDRRVAGTAAYMSPEQAAGGRLGEASDWYAVGVMLHEALTGRRPFEGGTTKVLAEKQAWDPIAPSELCPEVPPELDALCLALLARDPARRPGAGEVLRVFGASRSTPAPTPRSLVGRSVHLASLHRAWRRTRSQGPGLVWLRGPSGMGKSYLLDRFRTELVAGGTRVLSGRCFERESVRYNAFDALVEDLVGRPEVGDALPVDVGALLRLFPQLARVPELAAEPVLTLDDPHALRERAFRAFVELLGALAPAVVTLDDVQWGDADSARLLGALLASPAPLLFVLSHRSDDGDATFLRDVRAHVARNMVAERTVDVAELSNREALDLALVTLQDADPDAPIGGGAASEDLARRIAAESGGQPMFVEELCRWVHRHGEVVALRLDDAIRDRAATLPPPARQLLELLAVAGRPVAQELAERAHGGAALPELDLLRTARLVRTGPDRVEIAHDRVREAVAAGLASATLQARHRALAEAFEGAPDPDALLVHWEGAREPVRAASWARRAAEQAEAALAFDRAAVRWADLLRLTPEAVDRPEVLARRAVALENAGRGPEAGRAFREAAALSGPEVARDLLRRAAGCFLATGHAEEGLEVAELVLRPLGYRVVKDPRLAVPPLLWERARLWLRGFEPAPADPAADRFRLKALRSIGHGLSWLDFVQGELFLTRHLRAALDAGDRDEVVFALCAAWATRSYGSPNDRARLPELEARVSALAGDEPALAGTIAVARGIAAFSHGDFVGTVRWAREALAGRHLPAEEATSARLLVVWGLLFQGRLAETRAVCATSVREALDRGNLRFVATVTTEVQSVLSLAEDRPEQAVAAIEELAARWKRPGRFTLQQQSEMLAYGWIDAYRGDGPAAHDRLEQTWPALSASLLLNHRFVRLEAQLLRARCALAAAEAGREPGRLRASARRALGLAAKDEAPWSAAQRVAVSALLERAEGRDEAAVALLREGVGLLDATHQGLQAAAARHRLGTWLGGDEGAALVGAAAGWMRGEGVVNAERTVRMVLGS